MPLRPIATFASMASIPASLALLAGCAATIGQYALEQRTSQAIGQSVGQFSITERVEEGGGRIV